MSQFLIERDLLPSSVGSLPTWERHNKPIPLKPPDPPGYWIKYYPSLIHASWFSALPCLQNTTSCQFREENNGLHWSTYNPHQSSRPTLSPAPNHNFQPRKCELTGFELFAASQIVLLGPKSVMRLSTRARVSQGAARCQK